MTVLDSSGAVDYLLNTGVAPDVSELLVSEGKTFMAAPEILVVEVLSAVRRIARGGLASDLRAGKAIEDLGAMRVRLFPTLGLRRRSWELRHNVTPGDAMYLALAELIDEPLATKDARLAKAAARHTHVETILLGS